MSCKPSKSGASDNVCSVSGLLARYVSLGCVSKSWSNISDIISEDESMGNSDVGIGTAGALVSFGATVLFVVEVGFVVVSLEVAEVEDIADWTTPKRSKRQS